MPILASDIIETDPFTPALEFDSINFNWTISRGLIVASETGNGIVSDITNSSLLNFGSIYALSNVTADGVHFSIGTGSLLNAKGAEIFGTRIGVFLGGDYLATNRGTIVGAEDAGVELGKNTSGGAINNYGYIFWSDRRGE
jgi:hypothetical protein